MLSNEIPKFKDASGVIANRFMILRMTRSWLGNENLKLADELRPELPSILNWALEGLDSLNEAGRFAVPQSSRDIAVQMQDLASPVSAFVRDRLEITDPDATILRVDLYQNYRIWCEENGHKAVSANNFGRDLRAVVPELTDAPIRIAGKQHWCYSHIRFRSVSSDSADGDGAKTDVRQDLPGENSHVKHGETSETDEIPLWTQHELNETDAPSFRRPGCICIGQPRPCDYCQMVENNQGAKT